MRSLFLAWQSVDDKRAWYPIGRLDVESSPSPNKFQFRYVQGIKRAQAEAKFQLPLSFPDRNACYRSEELFPLFRNRVIAASRADFKDYLSSLDLAPDHTDPIEILSISGGERQTDSFEVFPKVSAKDGRFTCRFFLHGVHRLLNGPRHSALSLQPNEMLQVALELNNPVTGLAIPMMTKDYQMVGWAPRYLIQDLSQVVLQGPAISAKVVRLNEDAMIPASRRVLIEFSCHWPFTDKDPMSGPDFEPLHPDTTP